MSHWMSCYYCVSVYLVAFLCFYFRFVQLRQNVPCSTRSGAVPLPAADLLAHAVSPPKQCERCKEGSVSYHSLHLNSDSTSVRLRTLESCC